LVADVHPCIDSRLLRDPESAQVVLADEGQAHSDIVWFYCLLEWRKDRPGVGDDVITCTLGT